MSVGRQITSFVDHVVCDIVISFNVMKKEGEKGRVDKKFEVGLKVKIESACCMFQIKWRFEGRTFW